MAETVLIIVFVIFGILLAALVTVSDTIKEPHEMHEVCLECTQHCEHLDCKYHSQNVEGYTTKTDLMWSVACPYYTYREDLDDPEG